jgi:polar amino acid transport system substrate-binding protein
MQHHPSHRPHGIFVDLVHELAETSELLLSSVVVPYARAIALLRSGEVAMMFAYDTTRLHQVADALPSIAREDILLVGSLKKPFASMSELRGRVVGHLRGTEFDRDFIADPAIIKYEGNSYEQQLKMLLMGRLDAIVAPRTPLFYTMGKMGILREEIGTALILRKTSLSVYLRRQNVQADLHLRLSQACNVMNSQHIMEKLIRKYAVHD